MLTSGECEPIDLTDEMVTGITDSGLVILNELPITIDPKCCIIIMIANNCSSTVKTTDLEIIDIGVAE